MSERFDVKPKDLLDDLDLVFMCGLPGYGPGDLIDVSVDDDRVYITMADYFAAPLRLTPAEALALYAAGSALIALPELKDADALRRALAKLGDALGMTGEGLSGIDVELEGGSLNHLETLTTALERGEARPPGVPVGVRESCRSGRSTHGDSSQRSAAGT